MKRREDEEKLYNKEKINELAYKYIETDDDEVFKELLGELVHLIRPLVRKYKKYREYWDDLEQELLIKLWQQRKGLKDSSTKQPFQHFYRRITRYTVYFIENSHRYFDAGNLNNIDAADVFYKTWSG